MVYSGLFVFILDLFMKLIHRCKTFDVMDCSGPKKFPGGRFPVEKFKVSLMEQSTCTNINTKKWEKILLYCFR